jgi:hypothetical protein
MRRAVSWGVLGVVPAVAVWLAVAGSAGAADFDAARHAIGEMTAASRAVVDSGDRGDFGRMITDAERVVEAGERALAALPRPGNRHARDAADHVRQAMEHARQVIEAATHGRPDDAVAHARRALTQVRRGAGHAEAL